jgi:hypothetical protein
VLFRIQLVHGGAILADSTVLSLSTPSSPFQSPVLSNFSNESINQHLQSTQLALNASQEEQCKFSRDRKLSATPRQRTCRYACFLLSVLEPYHVTPWDSFSQPQVGKTRTSICALRPVDGDPLLNDSFVMLCSSRLSRGLGTLCAARSNAE